VPPVRTPRVLLDRAESRRLAVASDVQGGDVGGPQTWDLNRSHRASIIMHLFRRISHGQMNGERLRQARTQVMGQSNVKDAC
jgi:hypothetical protein